jgi:hypothetical protein
MIFDGGEAYVGSPRRSSKMTQIDLWPDTLSFEKLNAPVNLLREQASLLGQKTKNLLQAEVKQIKSESGSFSYSFLLAAPSLNYQYKLFEIHHGISLYPVVVVVESDILADVNADFERINAKPLRLAEMAAAMIDQGDERNDAGRSGLRVHSEKEFVDLLREILNSAKTVRIISALLSQADPNWNPLPF